jgi:hypothetical protein
MMRVEGCPDNPANLDFTFPKIDEMGFQLKAKAAGRPPSRRAALR